ncbi:hypothetical protein ACIRP0_35820 [Streptomyces sp. NPDC101733]|uniref:hypothetical protein n=1 Tax=unclassified Streptomyces TaxID=2593676 RepID=UPI003822183E
MCPELADVGVDRGDETLTAALDNQGYYSYGAYMAREVARRQESEEKEVVRTADAARESEASRWPCPDCDAPVYPGE